MESHCSCISEKEKYDKANYLKSSKSNNISKQAEWVKRIEDAIQNCESQRHKSILQNIRGNCNVPQKKKKFEVVSLFLLLLVEFHEVQVS